MKEGSVWTPLYSIFINVDSGHLRSRGSYSTSSTHTDISAACASQRELITPPFHTDWSTHNDIFSSEKIPGGQVAYSSCCAY